MKEARSAAALFKDFIILVPVISGAPLWGLLGYLVIKASMGNWIATLDFNRSGEGIIEMVVFPALAVFSLIGSWTYFRQLVRERRLRRKSQEVAEVG